MTLSQAASSRWRHVPRHGSRGVAVGVILAGLCGGSPAWAGDFSDTGQFVFDSAAVSTFDFEDGVPPLTDEEATPLVRTASDSALSGGWLLTVAPFSDAQMVAELPPDKRSYRASVWIRGGEATGYVVLAHEDDKRAAEVAVLYPSGRMTSDGWLELANDGILIDGARSRAIVGIFSTGGSEMDAVELVSEKVIDSDINPSCAGAVDSSACAPGQVCYWSECRNVSGWVPPIPAQRDDATAYFENRLRFLFGPFQNRTLDMPASLSAIEGMRHADDRWSYWNGFMLAVRRLHDGHTSTSGLAGFVIDNPKPLNACFIEGDADLSHALAPSDPLYRDVLVSHVGSLQTLGLKPGDRLVSVDGMHPIGWSRALIAESWSHAAISNHNSFAEHASRLGASISRFAHHIEVVRCDAQTQQCTPPEIVSIADWPAVDPELPLDIVSCDNRPLRHVPGAPANHQGGGADVYAGLLDVSNSDERIYGFEWESLYTTNGQDGVGAGLKQGLQLLADDNANALVLDHRKGNGGTYAGPEILWDFAVDRHPLTFTQTRQAATDEQPTLAEGLAIFQQSVATDQVLYAGDPNHSNMPIALLITEDVSASDWLPLGLKGAPNVRIFGPYETNGAFSTRYQLGYWLGMTVVLGSGDSYVADGRTQAGTGVAPDVVVLPKQSDLLMGKDTVLEAAVSWLREELEP